MNAGFVLLQALVGLAGLGIAVVVWADTAGAYLGLTSPGVPLRVTAWHGSFSAGAEASFAVDMAVWARLPGVRMAHGNVGLFASRTLPTLISGDVPGRSIFHTYIEVADSNGPILGCADD